MRSSSNSEMGPKIVQIETKYVETDEVNFRDVVQSLTGKNSSTDWIGRGRYNATATTTSTSMVAVGSNVKKGRIEFGVGKSKPVESKEYSMLMSNVSFREFDRFLLELPPIQIMEEEMPWI